MSIKRILIPVEDRDLTNAVVAHIKPLLESDGAEAILLRVVPPDVKDLSERGRHVESARADLEQVCGTLRAMGVRATADWVEGADPAATIVERARTARASLIVQATHAREDIERWVRGSVTERVLRLASAPMLLFNPWNRVSSFARILVALDGSEPAGRVLPLVAEFATQFGSEVIVLRVGPPSEGDEGVRVDALEESLEESLRFLRHVDVLCRALVVPASNVARAILDVAEEQGVDLIAMTSHGYSAWDTWPFGSTAEKVFRHSPLPLLIKRVAHLESPILEVVEPAEEEDEPAPEEKPAPRVLVPLDGSKLAARVLALLPTVLGKEPAKITLLRAHGSDAEAQASEESLSQAVDRLVEKGHLSARVLTVTGDPADEILKEARAERPELIVMSSHGRSGVARWVRGSVAERVLRRCPVPLLLMNAASLEEPNCALFRRILVPHDGSVRASTVLPWVERFARLHDAEVVLLRVADRDETELHGERETARGRLELTLGPALSRLTGAGVRVQPLVAFGAPAHEILAAAGSADLVALTTHGRSGPARWWFGSVAERVLRHCRRPLLVARAP